MRRESQVQEMEMGRRKRMVGTGGRGWLKGKDRAVDRAKARLG